MMLDKSITPNMTLHTIPRGVHVFLAGSIEMGKAIDWQADLISELSLNEHVGVIFNPRRPDWNPDWKQEMSNEPFRHQVEWELDNLDQANVVYFYFDKNTLSPVTLAELGYILGINEYSDRRVVVCCPDGYWRQGNVEIMCHRAGVKMHRSYEESVKDLEDQVAKHAEFLKIIKDMCTK